MGEQTIGILPVLVTQVALQAVLALILAGILGAFYRLYRHAYLRHWSLSWLALVVYIGASAVAGLTSGGGGHPWRVPAVLVSLVAGYLQVAWLLLGAWGLARGEDLPARTVRLVAGARGGGGAGPGLDAARPRVDRRALRDAECAASWPAVAYLAAAVAILARRRPLARVGSTFAGLALVLYAADQLAYFALGFVAPGGPARAAPVPDDVRHPRRPRSSGSPSWPGSSRASARSRCTRPSSRGAASARRPAPTASPRPRGRSGTCRRCSARSTRAWATCCPRGTSTSPSTTGRRAS